MKRFSIVFASMILVGIFAGVVQATPIVVFSDPVEGPLVSNWTNDWQRVGSYLGPPADGLANFPDPGTFAGLSPTEGDTFWSGHRDADGDGGTKQVGMRKFFPEATFTTGVYTITMDIGLGDGFTWNAPGIYLVADVDHDGVYNWNDRVALTEVLNPQPSAGEWVQWVYELEVDQNTVTGGGGDAVMGARMGFLIIRSIGEEEGYAFDNLEVTYIPEPSSVALLLLGVAGVFAARRRLVTASNS